MISKSEGKKIFKKFFEGFNTKGLKRIDFLVKENKDGSTVLFEISTWSKGQDYDYSYIILDQNKTVVYDEANGGYTNTNILYNMFDNINSIQYY